MLPGQIDDDSWHMLNIVKHPKEEIYILVFDNIIYENANESRNTEDLIELEKVHFFKMLCI